MLLVLQLTIEKARPIVLSEFFWLILLLNFLILGFFKKAPNKLLFPTSFKFARRKNLTSAGITFENFKKIAVHWLPKGVFWNETFAGFSKNKPETEVPVTN